MPEIDILVSFLEKNNIKFEKNCILSNHSSFRIGGTADLAVFPDNEHTVPLLELLDMRNIRYTVIGNGTNVLFSDKGFRGVVVFTGNIDDISVNGCEIVAGAGYSLTALASIAQKNSLTGLEFAYGIPGSVGGAVYMNAGAYGGEIADVLSDSVYYEPGQGVGTKTAAEHDFGYRHSSYADSGKIILRARFKLKYGDADEIKATMNDLMLRRKEKQPLDLPSAGSAFKRYPGYFTAALIDEAGLKGYSVGGAAVSEKHAGFIVNKCGATAEDVLKLIEIIRNRIFELHGIMIEPEIKFVGE